MIEEVSAVGVNAAPIQNELTPAEGWVTYRHNSGPEVANTGLEQWQATMAVLAILAIREGYATALAAPSVSAEDLVRLRDLAQAMQPAMEQFDLLGFNASNRPFHRVIYARCPNPVLVDRILIDMLERSAPFAEIEAHARNHQLNFLESPTP